MRGSACAVLVFVIALASPGCDPLPPRDCLLEGVVPAWPGARQIVAAVEGDAVRVRGFSGAVAPEAEVTITAGDLKHRITADPDGRFDVSLSGRTGSVLVEVAAESLSAEVRVRNLESALACISGAPAAVGTTPNDVDVIACGSDVLALVPTSGDGALESALLSGAQTAPPVVFPVDAAGRGSNPWEAAENGSALAAVSLFGQHTVALVDACGGRILDERGATGANGAPLLLDVTPAVSLSAPLDADGDGVAETDVTRMFPRHPQGVAFAGDRLYVTFSNVLEVGPPAHYGPGVLVAFDIVDNDHLEPAGHAVLPFQNAQSVVIDDEGSPWVSCSGVLERRDGAFSATSDGGLVRLDGDSLAIAHVLDLGRFAPGTPSVAGGWIVVGSLLEATVARFPGDATSLVDGTSLPTGTAGLESLFEVIDVGGGLALATEFGTDALHVVDVADGALHPWPFEQPLAVGPGGDAFRGLQAIARTPPSLLRPGVPEAAALLGRSSEVVPLHLWQVMGP